MWFAMARSRGWEPKTYKCIVYGDSITVAEASRCRKSGDGCVCDDGTGRNLKCPAMTSEEGQSFLRFEREYS